MIELIEILEDKSEVWKTENGTYLKKIASGMWETMDGFSLSPTDDFHMDDQRNYALKEKQLIEQEKEKERIAADKAALEKDAEEKLQCWSVTHPDDFIEAILIISRQEMTGILQTALDILRENPTAEININKPDDTDMSYKIKQKMSILSEKREMRNRKEGQPS